MTQANEIAEAITATVIASQADSDAVVRALANVLVWHLRRMPKDTAKPALAICSMCSPPTASSGSRRRTRGTAENERRSD